MSIASGGALRLLELLFESVWLCVAIILFCNTLTAYFKQRKCQWIKAEVQREVAGSLILHYNWSCRRNDILSIVNLCKSKWIASKRFFFQFPSLFSVVQLFNIKSCQFLSAESSSFGEYCCWYLYFIFPCVPSHQSIRCIFHQYLIAYKRCENIKAFKLMVLTSSPLTSFPFFFLCKTLHLYFISASPCSVET